MICEDRVCGLGSEALSFLQLGKPAITPKEYLVCKQFYLALSKTLKMISYHIFVAKTS